MKFRLALLIVPALFGVFAIGAAGRTTTKAEPQLAHMVFFTLKERTKEARAAFVASCQKYLSGHEGVVYFSLGTIAEDVVEPVSVRDFDVALHLIFESKEAELNYIKHPRHVEFVNENKEGFAKVRVFDTYLAAK